MSFLCDTNILSALTKKQSTQYTYARQALSTLRKRNEKLCLVPQNLIEFWAIATRPTAANGLGLNVAKASAEIKKFKRYFSFYDDEPNIFAEWENLVANYQVLGKNVHDARLVAAMIRHQITHFLTFNAKDFKRFSEITVVDPQEV